MGYEIFSTGSEFEITSENMDKAFLKVQQYLKKNKKIVDRWGFFEYIDVIELEDLKEIFEYMGFEFESDYISFCRGKYSDSHLGIFKVIAPFVEEESYIEFCDYEGCLFRYVFKNNNCEEIYPKIIWDND